MTVEFCGLELGHPVINASGTFDAIAARRVFGDVLVERFPFSAFVSKTVTLEPRQGNPPPRLWETAGGMINSIGLPNKGLEGYLAEDLPELARLPVPLIVKLTPNASDVAAVARAAEQAGASALSLINTVRGMALDPRTGAPWLGGVTGGVSGPGIRAVALAQCHEVANAVAIPLIGMGGVQSGRDALDLIRLGATLVAVGTESFRDPAAGAKTSTELLKLLADEGSRRLAVGMRGKDAGL